MILNLAFALTACRWDDPNGEAVWTVPTETIPADTGTLPTDTGTLPTPTDTGTLPTDTDPTPTPTDTGTVPIDLTLPWTTSPVLPVASSGVGHEISYLRWSFHVIGAPDGLEITVTDPTGWEAPVEIDGTTVTFDLWPCDHYGTALDWRVVVTDPEAGITYDPITVHTDAIGKAMILAGGYPQVATELYGDQVPGPTPTAYCWDSGDSSSWVISETTHPVYVVPQDWSVEYATAPSSPLPEWVLGTGPVETQGNYKIEGPGDLDYAAVSGYEP
jgi:hypothetical protein